jgi:hypothetical protein
VGITDTESAAATGGTALVQALRQVSTLTGSTAVPLLVSNSLTGSQTLPSSYFNCTWNTTGIVGGCLLVNATNTASGANSLLASFQVGLAHMVDIDKSGDIYINGALGGTGAATDVSICGGQGAGSCAPANTNGSVGALVAQGADNGSNGASAKAGLLLLRCGALTNAAPNAAALPGVCQLVEEFQKGSAVANVGDVVCMGTVAPQVTDCSHTGPATNIMGIASSTSNPISVVVEGEALVKVSNTAAVGDFVCWTGAAGTDGVPVDNGTSRCASGQYIGIVVMISGTIRQSSGTGISSTAMSVNLPLVQLHIGS